MRPKNESSAKMEKQIVEFNTYLHDPFVDEWADICREYGTLRTYKKGEELVTVGETARYVGLIKEGSVKYVVYTPDGEERVIGLETVGGYAASFPYCLNGSPSIFSIVANSDSEIYCLPVQRIVELSMYSAAVRQTIDRSLEAVFYNIYDRYVDLYALSPRERYEKLLRKCPELFDIFQLKDIASLLNITPAYLRKMRRTASNE